MKLFQSAVQYMNFIYLLNYIYIYSKEVRQRSVVATLSFTPVGDLQATDRSNLL